MDTGRSSWSRLQILDAQEHLLDGALVEEAMHEHRELRAPQAEVLGELLHAVHACGTGPSSTRSLMFASNSSQSLELIRARVEM